MRTPETMRPDMGFEQKTENNLSLGDRLKQPRVTFTEHRLTQAERLTGLNQEWAGKPARLPGELDSLELRTVHQLTRLANGRNPVNRRDLQGFMAQYFKESRKIAEQVAKARKTIQPDLTYLQEQVQKTKDTTAAKFKLLLQRMNQVNEALGSYNLEASPAERLHERVRKMISELKEEKARPVEEVSEQEIEEELKQIESINGNLIKAGAASMMEFGAMGNGEGLPPQIKNTAERARELVIEEHRQRRADGGEIDQEIARLEAAEQVI